MSPEYQIPLFRITLLGASAVGKSSIANAFVNNSFYCNYSSTYLPQLFYKLIRLPSDDSKLAKKKTLIVEIEDTYPSNLENPSYDIKNFFNVEKSKTKVYGDIKNLIPFSNFESTGNPIFFGEKYSPISCGRMAFILIFDPFSENSLQEVIDLYIKFVAYLDDLKQVSRPIIFLAANKMDKILCSEDCQKVLDKAEDFCQRRFIRFWKVSASSFYNIDKMFKNIISQIYSNTDLWEMDIESSEEEEEDNSICGVM